MYSAVPLASTLAAGLGHCSTFDFFFAGLIPAYVRSVVYSAAELVIHATVHFIAEYYIKEDDSKEHRQRVEIHVRRLQIVCVRHWPLSNSSTNKSSTAWTLRSMLP